MVGRQEQWSRVVARDPFRGDDVGERLAEWFEFGRRPRARVGVCEPGQVTRSRMAASFLLAGGWGRRLGDLGAAAKKPQRHLFAPFDEAER